MKKHKNLILFLIVTFLWSVFLGMAKIFLWSALKEDSRTLEEIAGYISLGAALSYLVGGALTYTFRKKSIAIASGLIVVICLIYGYMTDYFPLKNFMIIITIMGFFYGLWLTIKGILTTIEIMESGLGEIKINAITNIVIFTGILGGSYLGFGLYDKLQGVGVILPILVVVLATVIILFTSYDKIFKKHTLSSAIKKNIPNILSAIKKYFIYLIPIGILWSVSTAIGQKMLEISIDIMQKEPTKGIIVIVVSMVGAILGHIVSAFFKKRKINVCMLLTLLLSVSTLVFPNFLEQTNSFVFMIRYGSYLGLVFGIIVNIIEGKFYSRIGNENKKEFGSAAYGIVTSIIMFLTMLFGGIITKKIGINASFVFYGLILLIIIPFIRKAD